MILILSPSFFHFYSCLQTVLMKPSLVLKNPSVSSPVVLSIMRCHTHLCDPFLLELYTNGRSEYTFSLNFILFPCPEESWVFSVLFLQLLKRNIHRYACDISTNCFCNFPGTVLIVVSKDMVSFVYIQWHIMFTFLIWCSHNLELSVSSHIKSASRKLLSTWILI